MRIQAQTAQQIINNYSDKKDDDEAAQLEERYLRRVFETTRPLNLAGIDKKARSIERMDCLNAEEIYTPLLTLSVEQSQDSEARREGATRERLRSAVDLLNSEKRLVLLGEPGSGKSMFVSFVAQCLAGQRLGETCADLDRLRQPLPDDDGEPEKTPQPWKEHDGEEHGALLPVIFTLRDVAAKALPSQPDAPGKAAHLLAYLDQTLAEDALSGYAPLLRQRLDAPGGLMLFDGLDEVPEADKRRAQILRAVEEFAAHFPKCRILVTCRTYEYQQQEWQLTTRYFPTVAVLSPFHEGQMRWFITRWYRHGADVRGANRDDWEGRAAELKHALRSKPQLFSLARSPLLLTLMASLHAYRGGSLPDRRAQLYEEATEMLLDTWVKNKIVRHSDGSRSITQSLEEVLKIDAAEIKRGLSLAAFRAHEKQPAHDNERTADIAQIDLVDALLEVCHPTHLDPLDLAGHLRDRVGLLASHGIGIYTFPHRTFQEYLAACYLATAQNQDYPANIIALIRAEPTRWQEVLLLAAAIASSKVWDLADELCPKTVEDACAATKIDAQIAMLAAQALKEVGIDFSKPLTGAKTLIKERIQAWLKAILIEQTPKDAPLSALKRAQAGDLLAAFGDDRDGVGLKDHLPNIEWVEIPAGEFWMGSDATVDPDAEDDEQPRHRVHVPAFWMSRYPVTNAQYQAFVEDKGYEKASYWEAGGGWEYKEKYDWKGPRPFDDPRFALANHPVVGVSWYEAMAFCAWLTEKRNHTPAPSPCLGEGAGGEVIPSPNLGEGAGGVVIRLPTEAEWEYAARGPGDAYRRYPWGGDITPERANYGETNIGATSAAGAFPRGRVTWMGGNGLEEMAGNIWEWCADVWHKHYENAPDDGSAWVTDGDPDWRVLRGGAYYNDVNKLRCAVRFRYDRQGLRYDDRGFRLVCSRRVPVSPF